MPVINGRDFGAELDAALARVQHNVDRRIARIKAMGRPNPNRSAGQFLRWMKAKERKHV